MASSFNLRTGVYRKRSEQKVAATSANPFIAYLERPQITMTKIGPQTAADRAKSLTCSF